ncbi:MAG: hypothetical protein HY962_10485 [Ignavibacteriae bacterium]|nr:hypothetical protein [Ignavibacteriota bacterium]
MPLLVQMRDTIARWEAAQDRRAIFLSCYAMMTENMLAAIERDEFHDGPWVRRLLHRFAEYYFDALAEYEQSPETSPAPWRIAHDAAARHETMTLQNLFLGINAHINNDLALTLVDVLEDWDVLPQQIRRTRHEDYTLVNHVIAETIDAVQQQVVERYTPSLHLVDTLLGHADEWALAHFVARWREQVWMNAESLLATPRHSEQRAGIEALFEAMSAERANAVLLTGGVKALKTLW